MLTILFSIVMMILLFGITIFVHEFGHFIVARKCGLVVQAFSIGMGPAIWKKEVNGIVYKIGAFPIGGYVALPQLDPEGMEKVQGENDSDDTEPLSMPDISPWKKIAVSVAGPLCNVIFGILLAWVVFLASDLPTMEETPALIGGIAEDSVAFDKGIRAGDTIIGVNDKQVNTWTEFMVEALLGGDKNEQVTLKLKTADDTRTVQLTLAPNPEKTGIIIEGIDQAIPCLLGGVTANSPAEKAGLEANDIITSFDNTPVLDWFHFTDLVQATSNRTVNISVLRDDKLVDLKITPEYSTQYKQIMVGVGLGSFKMTPMDQIKSDAFMIFRVLKGLVTPAESGKVAKNLQGPIGIFKILFNALQIGFIAALGFVRFININLAVLNLLPIPVLDGGHICFSLWEIITKRKVHPKLIATLVNTFAILLIGAMIILSWRDAGGNRLLKFLKKAPVEQVEKSPADLPE